MKKHIINLVLILIFLVGLGILLYPTVSNYINERHMSRAVAAYDETVDNLTEEDYSAYFEAAKAYNEALAATPGDFSEGDRVGNYEETLDLGGGIMGYITIQKLGVELPIYHGTDDAVLQVAVGHLEGSSLPVGGESTHCVLSGHRGLPSATLFSNLDQMVEGDTFTLSVLNEVYTYEVDQILIVEPNDVSALAIEEGKDLCTLVTCTPYGINTHRLLVRGERMDYEEATSDPKRLESKVTSNWMKEYRRALLISVGILLILMIATCMIRKLR